MINIFSDMKIHFSPSFYLKAFPPIPNPTDQVKLNSFSDIKYSGIDVIIDYHLPQLINTKKENDGRLLFMENGKIRIRKHGQKRKAFSISVKVDIHALLYDMKQELEYEILNGR